MLGKRLFSRWFIGAAMLAAVEAAGIAALATALSVPAQAQDLFGRQRPAARQGGFFQDLFGPRQSETEPAAQPQADYSRAPSPRKPDPKAEPVTPTTSIVVMGDGMADWLAYGLEDAFSDSPEVAIVRKDRTHSGLLRYEYKSDLDWWHVARDTLAQEKANYVVMMLGVSDHQNIREKDLVKEADKAAKDQQEKTDADKEPATKEQTEEAEQPAIISPEPQPGKKSNGIIEFRSDQWAEIYSRRIDATIAALKSKGVPVFWVGLPAARGPRATADAVYLNDLYRARAERAGAVYIDVWDGFVDETGKYTTFGPDYEGQMRRLRSGDGIYFTKAGARKLAHYVEREIRRYMSNRALPVALPIGPIGPAGDSKSKVRPLAGPVVPLTVMLGNTDELAGGANARPVHGDAIAVDVLVKGEPVTAPPGRADDFAWPIGNDKPASPAAAVPAAPVPLAAVAPQVESKIEPKVEPKVEPKLEPKLEAKSTTKPARNSEAEKLTQNTVTKPKPLHAEDVKPKPPHQAPPRPLPFGSGGPFGWMR
jgi:hypothetical protein